MCSMKRRRPPSNISGSNLACRPGQTRDIAYVRSQPSPDRFAMPSVTRRAPPSSLPVGSNRPPAHTRAEMLFAHTLQAVCVPQQTRGLRPCAPRVGPAFDELLGERRGVAPKHARCRTPRVEVLVLMDVQSPASLSVRRSSARAGHLVPVALIGNAVSVCRAARIARSGFTGRC
jgi:hypothetical protein